MSFPDLSSAQLVALEQHAGRLKHDLGKYVSMQLRWLGPDATVDERREALASDLLHTRRGPHGSVGATEVWGEFRAGLFGEQALVGDVTADIGADVDVVAIDAAMAVIRKVAEALQASQAGPDDIDAGAAAAMQVAERCRSLTLRLRQARESHG